jgi:hypothetical protein
LHQYLSKKPLPVRILLKGKKSIIHKKFNDLSILGWPVRFEPGELMLCGSPEAVRKMTEKEGIVFQAGMVMEGDAKTTIVARNSSGAELLRYEIPGRLKQTMMGVAFEGHLDQGLISLLMGPMRIGKVLIRHPIDIRRWKGRRLLNLPYFDLITGICNMESNTVERHYSSEYQGSSKWEIRVQCDTDFNDERAKQWLYCIEILNQARRAAEYFHINPILDFEQLSKEATFITELHDVFCRQDDFSLPVPNVQQRVQFDSTEHVQENRHGTGEIAFVWGGECLFLGEKINVPPFVSVYTNISVWCETPRNEEDQCDVVIEGTEHSMFYAFREESPVLDADDAHSSGG